MSRLDHTFAALADPTRRSMVRRLAKRPYTVSQLAKPLSMSLPAVSKHVRVLERAGLIRRTRVARAWRCELRPAALREASSWIERCHDFWNDSFERLDAVLRESTEAPPVRSRGTKEK